MLLWQVVPESQVSLSENEKTTAPNVLSTPAAAVQVMQTLNCSDVSLNEQLMAALRFTNILISDGDPCQNEDVGVHFLY